MIHEMINFFINKEVYVNWTDFEGKNILHKYLECYNANEYGIKLLLDAGIDFHQTNNQGNNPLLEYMSHRKYTKKLDISGCRKLKDPDMKIINTLIEFGTDINSVND